MLCLFSLVPLFALEIVSCSIRNDDRNDTKRTNGGEMRNIVGICKQRRRTIIHSDLNKNASSYFAKFHYKMQAGLTLLLFYGI